MAQDSMHRRTGIDAPRNGIRCTWHGFRFILQRVAVNNATGDDAHHIAHAGQNCFDDQTIAD